MIDRYTPELGQMVFGQWQEYKVPEWLITYLKTIRTLLNHKLSGGVKTEEYTWSESPFEISRNPFDNGVFQVRVPNPNNCWDEEDEDEPYWNFKWEDLKICWYKYLGRGMSMNREITGDEGSQLLLECLDSLRV